MILTAQAFTSFDPDSLGHSVMVVVERIVDRWQMDGLWFVEFDAFVTREGVCIRDVAAFDTYGTAFDFQPGSTVSYAYNSDDLPF